MPSSAVTRALLFTVLAAAVGLTSLFARRVLHDKLVVDSVDGWVAQDADTLYHVRRVARLADEGEVAGEDPYLNFPHGARVPWPPYYTRIAAACTGPLSPDEAPRRAQIEQTVASLPVVFGVAASVLTALLALLLAGPGAALFAGLYHGLTYASIAYSRVGNGDHHAFISLLLTAELCLFTAAARRGFRSPGASTLSGLVAGAIAGLALGAWVASLIHVALLQLALGALLFANARARLPGLAPFGAAFHGAAALVVWPAVAASPWKDEFPWMVVNLSWFHLAHLALGGLVFVPLLVARGRNDALRRRYPYFVLAGIALLAALVLAVDAGPGRGIREGFEWVSRKDEFMAGILESRPLLAPGTVDGAELARLLGKAIFVLPVAWLVALAHALRSRERTLLPIVVAVPVLALQAGTQARFADALSPASAALIGWLVARLLGAQAARGEADSWMRRPPGFGLAGLAIIGLVAAVQTGSLRGIERSWATNGYAPRPVPRDAAALRAMLEWLRTHSPEPGADGESRYCVMADWSHGHAIEWGANRPSVATNFGSYVGVDSYVDPGRFFLAEDPAAAEAVLEARRARYVLLTSDMPTASLDMIRTACPEREPELLERTGPDSGRLRQAWYRTVGARLMFLGEVAPFAASSPSAPLDFLRLVHASPSVDRRPALGPYGVESSPFGWIWERVPGARLEARGEPGETFAVELVIELPPADLRFVYRADAVLDGTGRATLRVPYPTAGTVGDARVAGEPRWTLGERAGRLAITPEDVQGGRTIEIRLPR